MYTFDFAKAADDIGVDADQQKLINSRGTHD